MGYLEANSWYHSLANVLAWGIARPESMAGLSYQGIALGSNQSTPRRRRHYVERRVHVNTAIEPLNGARDTDRGVDGLRVGDIPEDPAHAKRLLCAQSCISRVTRLEMFLTNAKC